MFKIAIKFLLLAIVLTGACSFLLTEKAAAAACNGAPGVPNVSWGVTDGIHSNAMAGLRVYAQDGSNGNPLSNVTYVLNSAMPGVPNPLTAPNGSKYNPNERIFDYPPGSAGRWSQKSFTTGEVLHRGGGAENAFSCAGWSVLGPGTAAQQGNGFVIDCGEFVGGVYRSTEYWISSITKPNGQSGHWEIKVDGVTRTPNLDNQPMSRFVATNGDNVRIDLIWHPDPVRLQASGACTYFTVTGSKFNRREVQINGVSAGRGLMSGAASAEWQHPANFHEWSPAPVGQNVSPGEYKKEWWYTPTANTIHITVVQHEWNGSSWGRTVLQDYDQSCFTASCSVTSIEGTGPNNIVLAGQQYKVRGNYTNTSPPPDYMIIWNPGLTISNSQVPGNNGDRNVSMGPLYSGWTIPFEFTLTAPNNITTDNVYFTPVYFGPSGGPCLASVNVYQSFSLVPKAVAEATGTNENPGTINYNTSITNNGPAPVTAPTSSTFTSTPYTGPSQCANAGPVNTNGPYNPGGPNYIINPASCSPPQVSAGDQFCAEITFTGGYNQGYVGPGGSIVPNGFNGPPNSKQCVTVKNKPYFKVKGSGASAGVSLRKSDGKCNDSNIGLLAGWNNNSGGQERGAGAELSALALIKISGFASAQRGFNVNTGTDAAKLTFANNGTGVNKTVDVEDPALGGNFTDTSSCMNSVSPPTGGASATLPASPITTPKSTFVNGDVYIGSNITYGATTSVDTAPSFILKATGNIFIGPGVTRLDGVFMSEQNIYTCVTSNGKQPANSYDTCKNQLLVHGSFVADQIKLGRTFGSLRDEQPKAGPPASALLDGVAWKENGPIAGMSCTQALETADPNTWNDNYICAPASSGLQFYWTSNEGLNLYGPNGANSSGAAAQASFNTMRAQGKCAKWDIPEDPHTWYDNYLCSNQTGLTFSKTADTSPNRSCLRVTESADPSGQWASTGYFVCGPRTPAAAPTPSGPPFASCSNRAGAAQATTTSCASEVFELSPELFLSTPAIQPPNNCAKCQWDAVTSLPPVL